MQKIENIYVNDLLLRELIVSLSPAVLKYQKDLLSEGNIFKDMTDEKFRNIVSEETILMAKAIVERYESEIDYNFTEKPQKCNE